jgi:hypothetical protein
MVLCAVEKASLKDAQSAMESICEVLWGCEGWDWGCADLVIDCLDIP